MALNLPEALPMPASRTPQAYLHGDTSASARALVAWALFDWIVIGAAWAAMAFIDGAWVLIAGTLVVASRLHALGAVLHDACHKRRRDASCAWRLVEMLAGWPIASTIEAMGYHHLRHHALSGTPMDPYGAAVHARVGWRRPFLILRGALLPFWWTLRGVVAPLALLAPRVRKFYGRAFLQDRSGRDLRDHAGVISCARADIAQLTAQIIVLGGAFAAGLPVLSFYLVPWMLAGVLNARRVVYEHAWLQRERHSRRGVWESTLDHDPGLIGNAVFYPHNLGMHRLHHLYPTISFVHLRRLAEAIRRTGEAQT
jgi:fatty acid desaturase